MSLEHTTDDARWAAWCAAAGLDSPYYDFSYLRIWEGEEGGERVGLRWQRAEGVVLYPVLRRSLAGLDGGEGRCDLRAAYDFGGPLTLGPPGLLADFEAAFRRQAREWGVVSEFARLHPHRLAARPEDAIHHAEHHCLELEGDPELLEATYHPSFRRNLRKARRSGLRLEVASRPDPAAADAFARLYAATMDKVGATQGFRFAEGTLRGLAAHPALHLASALLNDEAVAAMLLLVDGDTLFYFLGASDADYLGLRPNHLLFDAAARHASSLGLRRFHLGGGHPSLRRFKAQVAPATVPYFLLKRVHDRRAYADLCRRAGVDDDGPFPAYQPG